MHHRHAYIILVDEDDAVQEPLIVLCWSCKRHHRCVAASWGNVLYDIIAIKVSDPAGFYTGKASNKQINAMLRRHANYELRSVEATKLLDEPSLRQWRETVASLFARNFVTNPTLWIE